MHHLRAEEGVAFELLVVLIKAKLLNNLINSLAHRPSMKSAVLDQSLAVFEVRRARDPANIPAVDLGAKDGPGDSVIFINGVINAHAKAEEHDAHDTACAGTAGELKIVSWQGNCLEVFLLLDANHELFEDDEAHDTPDATAIEGEETESLGMLGRGCVDHCDF